MRAKVIFAGAAVVFALSTSAAAQYGYGTECEDARSRAESVASDLSSYARRLEQCADNQDFSDDCYTEFRRVKSAHGDYESAVSEVSSYCE